LPLVRLPWTTEVARAGFRAGACYLLRPDGYVAYAAAPFDADSFLAYLRERWGWHGRAPRQTGG
jgi:hypothetical protein